MAYSTERVPLRKFHCENSTGRTGLPTPIREPEIPNQNSPCARAQNESDLVAIRQNPVELAKHLEARSMRHR